MEKLRGKHLDFQKGKSSEAGKRSLPGADEAFVSGFTPRQLLFDALAVERTEVGETKGPLRKRIKNNLDYLSFLGRIVSEDAPEVSVVVEFNGSIFPVNGREVSVVMVDGKNADELLITKGLIDDMDENGSLISHPVAELGKVSKKELTLSVLQCFD